MVEIIVYGVHERDDMIKNIVSFLNGATVIYDEKHDGCFATCRKAWLKPCNETHKLVLPDDVELCCGFQEICERIVKAQPNKLISLFPPIPLNRKKHEKTPYQYAYGLWGIGVIMPTEWIKQCWDWIDSQDFTADDTAIWHWATMEKKPIITTVPSILQHIGDESLIGNNEIRHTPWFEKQPKANWESQEINVMKF